MTEPSAAPLSRVPDEAQIREALRNVIDPELGMNIVALGLIYRIDVTADKVLIDLTMTSPACPMGDMIMEDVERTLSEMLPSGVSFEAQLVWEPPWNPSMMDASAKAHFGWTPD